MSLVVDAGWICLVAPTAAITSALLTSTRRTDSTELAISSPGTGTSTVITQRSEANESALRSARNPLPAISEASTDDL